MPICTACGTPGAYIGFSTIECRNPDCDHFKLEEKKLCPCCGKEVCEAGKATKLTNPCKEIEIDQKDAAKTAVATSLRDRVVRAARLAVFKITDRKFNPETDRVYVNKSYFGKPDPDKPPRLVPLPEDWTAQSMSQYCRDVQNEGRKLILKTVQKDGHLPLMEAIKMLRDRRVSERLSPHIVRNLINDPLIVDKGAFVLPTINFSTAQGNMSATMRVFGPYTGAYDVDLKDCNTYEHLKEASLALRTLAIEKQIVIVTLIQNSTTLKVEGLV